MWKDGFFVTPMPLRDWSFRDAAATLIKDDVGFLSVHPGYSTPTGRWSLSCFPYKKYVGVVLNESHVRYIRNSVSALRTVRDPKGMYYTISAVAKIMQEAMEYPPYPLEKGSLEMRSWAVKMFWERLCLHMPPEVSLP